MASHVADTLAYTIAAQRENLKVFSGMLSWANAY